jgi:hypothetical protein
VVRGDPAVLIVEGVPRRLGGAVVGGIAFGLYTALSRLVPALHPLRLDIVVSLAVALSLLAAFLYGLTPLRALGHRLLLVALVALAAALLFTYVGWLPGANVAKALFAAGVGLWLAAQIDTVAVFVLIAALAAVADTFSVLTAAGPTHALLASAPQVVGYFAVAMTWFGYSYRDAYSAIGTSDLIFFSLFLGAVLQFRLRVTLTVVAMTASFLVTVVLALWARALPALPLLSAAFLLVNADLLWQRRGARARGSR